MNGPLTYPALVYFIMIKCKGKINKSVVIQCFFKVLDGFTHELI